MNRSAALFLCSYGKKVDIRRLNVHHKSIKAKYQNTWQESSVYHMNKLKKRIKNISYNKKIFYGMFFSAIVPIIICLVGVLISFRISNEARFEAEAESLMENALQKLTSNCTLMREAVNHIAKAPATKRILVNNRAYSDDAESPDASTVYRLLYTSSVGMGRTADYAIYDRKGSLVQFAGDPTYIRDELSVNWGILYELLAEAGEKESSGKLSDYQENVKIRAGRIYGGPYKNVVLRLGRVITDSEGSIIGFVVAQISPDSFAKIFRGLTLNGLGSLYVRDEFGEMVYRSSEIEEEKKSDRIYTGKDEQDGLSITYRQRVEHYDVMSRSLWIIMGITALLGLVMSLLISKILSRMFYSPIRRMSEGMEKIRQGDFSARVKVESEDELGQLSEMFNSMSSQLTDNMNQLVNREKELANANIKMMQAQLNPHFIYNTLDTMKWIGKENKMPEVATLSSGLADIMRASISPGQTVTLRKELELIESYASILQIRFDDKFELVTDIREDVLECEVPKLILQPIVENSIIHGLDGRSYGQVLISGRRDNEKLILKVSDDGAGTDGEILRKLNNREQLAKGSNIGFHNVDSIIRLRYGEGYGLYIQTGENGGTEVIYTLPYIS